MELSGKTVGFALTASYCTFEATLGAMERLTKACKRVCPILSYNAQSVDTRFGKAADFLRRIGEITGERPMKTITEAEPIGPRKLLDVLLVAPCTGNTLGKLAHGITDTPVLMAAKSSLRNGLPVVLAVSTNDGLGASAANIGLLLARKNIYFVPYGQDDPLGKPLSLMAKPEKIEETLMAALDGKQIQPILL
jgi:dipicolinate synthase subunit B